MEANREEQCNGANEKSGRENHQRITEQRYNNQLVSTYSQLSSGTSTEGTTMIIL